MIRCLLVDDSASFRQMLRSILGAEGDLSVVGEAADGASAVEQTLALKPDVITMDVRMPRQDGFEAIRQIMEQQPTPILVIGAEADDTKLGIAFRALQLGAVEVLAKPRGEDPKRFSAQSRAIIDAVRAVSGVKVVRRFPKKEKASPVPPGAVSCVGIAASTGGPMALRTLLAPLPRSYALPLLVVQHITDGFTGGLVKWLADQTAMRVKLAEAGERPEPGSVYIAPSGKHLMLSLGRIRLDDSPPVRGLRPSASLLFASLARDLGAQGAGIVLTGMGDDGATGLAAIRQAGGFTAAQGPESCTVYGMPKVALESGAAAHCLELGEMPGLLRQLAGEKPAARPRGRRRLLLVDDTASILAVEKEVLGTAYDLTIAQNGKEALDAIARQVPDAVVMDLNMPVMRGDEALRLMREQPALRNLPIILVTSEQSTALRRHCWELGCNALLDKPIDRSRLFETVAQYVG